MGRFGTMYPCMEELRLSDEVSKEMFSEGII